MTEGPHEENDSDQGREDQRRESRFRRDAREGERMVWHVALRMAIRRGIGMLIRAVGGR